LGLPIAAVFFAAVFTGSYLPGGSSRNEGKGRYRIAFDHHPDEARLGPTVDIYSVNSDGTNLRALTSDGHSRAAQWSPDGRHIAYTHETAWPTRLPRPEYRIPDGEWHSHVFRELYVMNSNGGNQHALRGMRGLVIAAEWSPDGHRILYICDSYPSETVRPGEPREVEELYSMGSNGQHARLLRRFDAPVSVAAWSPDGKTLAVYGATSPDVDHGPIAGLFLMPVYGTGEIGPIAVPITSLTWNPDGTKLLLKVFAREQDAYDALGEVNADGSHLKQITDSKRIRSAFLPKWSPDGRQIAFDAFWGFRSSSGMGDEEIFIMNADGSGVRQLTHDPNWSCERPAWAPDGSQLAFSCEWKSPPCRLIGQPSTAFEPGPGCVRRIFVLSMTDPDAKPVQITQIDGTSPVFAPVP
jgi:Tol biopolymer transport system component